MELKYDAMVPESHKLLILQALRDHTNMFIKMSPVTGQLLAKVLVSP